MKLTVLCWCTPPKTLVTDGTKTVGCDICGLVIVAAGELVKGPRLRLVEAPATEET